MLTFLLLIYTALFAWLSWRDLRYGIMVIIALLPTYLIRFHIWFIPFTLLELMILIVFGVFCLQNRPLGLASCRIKTKDKKLKILYVLIICFLLVSVLAIIYSPNKIAALGIWKAYFLEPILFMLVFVSIIKTNDHLVSVFYALGVSALVVSIFAICQKFTGIFIPAQWFPENIRRVTSFYGYPNAIGLYLAPIIVLYLGWLSQSLGRLIPSRVIPRTCHSREGGNLELKPKLDSIFHGNDKIIRTNIREREWLPSKRLILFQCIVVATSTLAIIWSQTEAAWLAIGISLILLGMVHSKKSRWLTLLVIAVMIFMVLSSSSLIGYFTVKANCFISRTCADKSIEVRIGQWKETTNMLKDNFVLGAGLAGYQSTIQPYHKIKGVEIYLYPHNIFLNFWSEIGLAGMIIFLLLLIQFFVLAKSINYSHRVMLMLSMVAFIIHGLFDAPYFKNDLSVLFWVLIGSVVVCYNMKIIEIDSLQRPNS